MNMLRNLLYVLAFCVVSVGYAADSSNYQIPSDVQPAGGGDTATSTNYTLQDTIGESNIGEGSTTNYTLNAGYRQVLEATLSLSCSSSIPIDTIVGFGQKTGSGSCTVTTDSPTGYTLAWLVSTGSGGTNTGYMIANNTISSSEYTIEPLRPAVVDTPETWSVATSKAAWGGRLSSKSDDTEAKWGTDNTSEKFLNIATGSYTIADRSSPTALVGSVQIIEMRAEVGTDFIQETGDYTVVVELIASTL